MAFSPGRRRRAVRPRLLAAALVTAVVVAVALVLLLGGETANPFQYSAGKQAQFEQRAAAGESHLLYANSPGGVIATARRVAALGGPIRAAASTAHVDPRLIEGMVYLESGGRPDAIAGGDPGGAAGVSQILPQTATGLLGLKVNLGASRSLSAQVDAAQAAHDGAAVKRLEARRQKVDERFDPSKALAATGRYLSFALTKLPRADLAVESYHMGIGNLANATRAYAGPAEHSLASKIVDERKLTYAQLYFGSTPRSHAAAYRLLAALGDDSSTYYFRVLAASEIMRLYRQDPGELARLNQLQTSRGSAEAVLHPPGSTDVFADPAALSHARARGTLVELPAKPTDYVAAAPALAGLYRTLRPEALGALYYIGERVHTLGGEKAPLVVEAATRDAAHDPRASRYSLYTTGYSFDISRHYASARQAQAFQAMLDRLQSLDAIAWERNGDVIHVTVSNLADGLVPLIHGASLGDES